MKGGRLQRRAQLAGRGVGLLVAALTLFCAENETFGAPRPPSPAAIVAAPTAAKAQYEAAQNRLDRLRADQQSLEARITRLKKAGDRPQALDRLLKQSVGAEGTLAAARNEARRAEARFDRALKGAIRAIDTEIRRRVPELKQGPIAARRAAAHHINALRTARKTLRTEAARLAQSREREKAWAQYRVRVEAQDGPSELTEKADFVEDTRDKVVRKRQALIQLLGEARQEREIAQVARDFRTDVTLFDEEARDARVLRQSANPETVATVGQDTPNSDERGGLESAPSLDDDSFADVPNPTGATPPALDQGTPSTPRVDPGGGASVGLPAVNPDVLLNLRVEDLAAGALDVATLERYVEDLRALEQFLSEQAEALRKRADTLEADEARDLSR